MSTFVYMTRCDGCGLCVDICPSDIMHIDETIDEQKILNLIFVGNAIHVLKLAPIMQLMFEVMLILHLWVIVLE